MNNERFDAPVVSGETNDKANNASNCHLFGAGGILDGVTPINAPGTIHIHADLYLDPIRLIKIEAITEKPTGPPFISVHWKGDHATCVRTFVATSKGEAKELAAAIEARANAALECIWKEQLLREMDGGAKPQILPAGMKYATLNRAVTMKTLTIEAGDAAPGSPVCFNDIDVRVDGISRHVSSFRISMGLGAAIAITALGPGDEFGEHTTFGLFPDVLDVDLGTFRLKATGLHDVRSRHAEVLFFDKLLQVTGCSVSCAQGEAVNIAINATPDHVVRNPLAAEEKPVMPPVSSSSGERWQVVMSENDRLRTLRNAPFLTDSAFAAINAPASIIGNDPAVGADFSSAATNPACYWAGPGHDHVSAADAQACMDLGVPTVESDDAVKELKGASLAVAELKLRIDKLKKVGWQFTVKKSIKKPIVGGGDEIQWEIDGEFAGWKASKFDSNLFKAWVKIARAVQNIFTIRRTELTETPVFGISPIAVYALDIPGAAKGLCSIPGPESQPAPASQPPTVAGLFGSPPAATGTLDAIRIGDPVRLKTGGPVMIVDGINGNDVLCRAVKASGLREIKKVPRDDLEPAP
jgi:uncharacterized protein YodC (DUF2158 family)